MIIAWFSCGATSAVACKIALSLYDDVQIYYIETGSGHPDNARFLANCEKWYNQPIYTIRSDKYINVEDVLTKKRYINGPTGAACTFRLLCCYWVLDERTGLFGAVYLQWWNP